MDDMSSVDDRAASRLEEFLASADLSDLRSLLRILGDAGGSDDFCSDFAV